MYSTCYHNDAPQDAITAAAAASAAALDPSQQQPAADAHRLALLEDIYSRSTIPTTLSRPLPGAQGLDSQHKPAWRSLKGKAASPTHEPDSALSTARGQHPHPHQHSQHSGKQDPRLAAKCQIRQAKAKGTERRDPGQVLDADWEAQLPAGLKPEQCANLPQTVSVRQLVEVCVSLPPHVLCMQSMFIVLRMPLLYCTWPLTAGVVQMALTTHQAPNSSKARHQHYGIWPTCLCFACLVLP
jgi:hypothetical protein